MKSLEENSVDSIVTDPPYGLSFMGKKWDYDVPSVEIWREALRVLKPGGHLLAFGGTRTYHRLAVNIEDAGFEIRDQIMWLYGSGFPKSMNVSKAIDKAAGAEREVVGQKGGRYSSPINNIKGGKSVGGESGGHDASAITAPSTDSAKQWQGWGTALKPANEPIVVARKPLEKGLTVAQNVQKYGTGALNIDASRVTGGKMDPRVGKGISYGDGSGSTKFGQIKTNMIAGNPDGRFPANVILDEEAGAALDAQTGDNVSRFFYCAKASKRERNAGLEGMPEKTTGQRIKAQSAGRKDAGKQESSFPQANHHPTVKPIALMEYLIRLVTPAEGVVLDPFMGSGSTGVAAKNLGFEFIGCEMNPEYVEIAKNRIKER